MAAWLSTIDRSDLEHLWSRLRRALDVYIISQIISQRLFIYSFNINLYSCVFTLSVLLAIMFMVLFYLLAKSGLSPVCCCCLPFPFLVVWSVVRVYQNHTSYKYSHVEESSNTLHGGAKEKRGIMGSVNTRKDTHSRPANTADEANGQNRANSRVKQ